jgi:hypothetical protein
MRDNDRRSLPSENLFPSTLHLILEKLQSWIMRGVQQRLTRTETAALHATQNYKVIVNDESSIRNR